MLNLTTESDALDQPPTKSLLLQHLEATCIPNEGRGFCYFFALGQHVSFGGDEVLSAAAVAERLVEAAESGKLQDNRGVRRVLPKLKGVREACARDELYLETTLWGGVDEDIVAANASGRRVLRFTVNGRGDDATITTFAASGDLKGIPGRRYSDTIKARTVDFSAAATLREIVHRVADIWPADAPELDAASCIILFFYPHNEHYELVAPAPTE